MRRGLLCVVAAVGLSGCYASMGSMREKRSDAKAGVTKEYKDSCRARYATAKIALANMRLDVLDEDEGDGEILARRGSRSGDGSFGDRLAIWFDPIDGKKGCRVRVYARGQNAFAAGGDDWPSRFFRFMKLARDKEADE